MKRFFNRDEEEIEDYMEEDEDLDVINLDETAGWSKLDVAEEMAKQRVSDLMEEIGDELAILDVVEEDIKIEELKPRKVQQADTYKKTEQYVPSREMQELTEIDLEEEELSDDELEIVHLQDDDVEIERLSDDEEDEEYMPEEEDDEEDESSLFAFFTGISGWFARWSVMDKVVALTGILVLAVAIVTVSTYAGKRGLDKQLETVASVGEQLETIGVTGHDKLFAVADAKKAMLEAVKLEAELNQEYEENELSSEVKVVMKMTSVQKDLKIKFVNKKTGKLVGNVPFEVKIVDSENKTYHKIDEDMDGIIYLTNIVPGNYSVSMVELADEAGYSISSAVEKIKVKETIAYEKIDVTEEIKDQSEVDVSKEDTAQKTETEATLQDTVEWVESTKKEVASEEGYTQVSKDTIADPGLSASLYLDVDILRVMHQSILANGIIEAVNENSEGQDVAVEKIILQQESISLIEGESKELTIEIKPENATNKKVSWSSSDSSVATVENGKVTAKAEGNAVITVITEDGDKTDFCNVTVEKAVEKVAVTGVAMSETSISLTVGGQKTLTATIIPANATNPKVTWSTSDSSVATVEDGKVSAMAGGSAIITVTTEDGKKTASCTVTVEKTDESIAVTGVSLSETSIALAVGEEKALTATVTPSDATQKKVSWKSSDEKIATVEDGKVSAVAVGSATITVTTEDGKKTASCTVSVEAKNTDTPSAVTGVTLNVNTLELSIGASETLKATVTPENAANKELTWSSDKAEVASVDANGKVTGKAEGTATITVTTKDGKKTATCKVTVSKTYDPKNDKDKLLKDKSGNQIYILTDGKYVEAKAADYYKYDTFYKKEKVSQYIYTGWQNLDGKTYYFDKNGNKVTGTQIIQGAQYNFNSDGTLNTGSGILGIDVSTWNGNIDWNKVKNSGVSYVIIRTGFRGSTQGALVEDNRFKQNIKGATNAGLKVGVYFFSQAINEVEAVEEASMVLSQVKGYKLTYPVFIDVEPSGGRADKLSSGDRTKVINAFCQTIQNGGLRAGIYANKTWLSQKMNISALSGYKIWLAQYNSTVTYSGRYDIWQYSDKGTIPGIPEKVDLNLSYLTY